MRCELLGRLPSVAVTLAAVGFGLVSHDIMADTSCNSFKEAMAAQNPPVPVPFCEDFDTYCVGEVWPNACPSSGATNTPTPMRQLWSNSSWNTNTRSYCGAEFAIEEGQTILSSPPYGGRSPNGGDEHGALGQETVDLLTCTGLYGRQGNSDPAHHKCIPLSTAYGSGVSAVTGSDANPLILTFTMSSGIQTANKMAWSTGYIELALDNDPPQVPGQYTGPRKTHAPMDYVWVGVQAFGETCASCYGLCGPNNGVHVPWRTICQQEFPRTASPGSCPDLDDEIRPVLAIGAVAELDNNPCHCENISGSQEPQNNHLSFFDGSKWIILKTSDTPPAPGFESWNQGFVYADKLDTVTLYIKSATVDIEFKAKQSGASGGALLLSRRTNIPRFYTGGFNKLRGGAAAGCELVGSGSYACIQPGNGEKCLVEGGSRCDNGTAQLQNSGYVSFDGVVLFGGEGASQAGSCCHANGSCSEGVLPASCGAAGDVFGGPNSHCSTTTCCAHGSYTWADADADGDVDQDDFGTFQRCITGPNPPGGVPDDCTCFDRVHVVPGIDQDDFDAFKHCVTGSGVPWTPSVNCPANAN